MMESTSRSDRTSAEDEILEVFGSLMRHIADSHAPQFLGTDITMAQAKVLYLVSLRPGMGMSALAAQLGVGLSAVSGLVDRLVESGYLQRREDPSDRRQQLVTVTGAGAIALDRIRELRAELMRTLMTGLDRSELDALRTSVIALDREVQRLEQAAPDREPRHERTSR